jgi:hypothetical protein
MSEILYNNIQYEPLIDFIDENQGVNYFLNDLWIFDYQPVDTLKYYIDSYIHDFIE